MFLKHAHKFHSFDLSHANFFLKRHLQGPEFQKVGGENERGNMGSDAALWLPELFCNEMDIK